MSLKKRIETKIKLATTKAAREIAKILPDLIKLRVRQEEQGINSSNDLKKLAPLEKSTIQTRERYKENLHPDTNPRTSNLTGTGQLLDSIKAKNIGSKITATIGKSRRRGELSGSGSKLTNEKVREYVEKKRPFFELSNEERKEAEELLRQIITEEINKALR